MTVPGVGGRPLKFESPEELEKKIDAYFQTCEDTGEPLTVASLAAALDCDPETLLNYQKKETFFGTIKRAKVRIQAAMEKYALTAKNPAGAIFLLKANYNYSDKLQIESTRPVVIQFDESDRGLFEDMEDK
jgi:hypothetical protein